MRTLLLDRDGVINRDSPDFIRSPGEFRPLPGALEAVVVEMAAAADGALVRGRGRGGSSGSNEGQVTGGRTGASAARVWRLRGTGECCLRSAAALCRA